MNRELINTWLGLPQGDWPPDHYTLLGLPPCTSDLAGIEQRVHERMLRIRCYQLGYPEQATEVMNRLAQALVCLTDLEAKKAYDAALAARTPSATQVQEQPPPKVEPATTATVKTQVEWDTATTASPAPEPASGANPAAPKKTPGPSPILLSAPVDPVFETARSGLQARRGWGPGGPSTPDLP